MGNTYMECEDSVAGLIVIVIEDKCLGYLCVLDS